jgi:hypothetical protein
MFELVNFAIARFVGCRSAFGRLGSIARPSPSRRKAISAVSVTCTIAAAVKRTYPRNTTQQSTCTCTKAMGSICWTDNNTFAV